MNKLNVIIFITTLTSIVQVQLRYQCTFTTYKIHKLQVFTTFMTTHLYLNHTQYCSITTIISLREPD